MNSQAHTHQIRHNGQVLVSGQKELKIVFNNLSGRNFKNPLPWQSSTHPQYLDMMAKELNVVFAEGDSLEFVSLDSGAVEQCETLSVVPAKAA